jgi:hypothetical protein
MSSANVRCFTIFLVKTPFYLLMWKSYVKYYENIHSYKSQFMLKYYPNRVSSQQEPVHFIWRIEQMYS